MGIVAEGTIYIPLEDFWTFVAKYTPEHDGEEAFGSPLIVNPNGDLHVPYAIGSECNPSEWADPPQFLKDLKRLSEYQARTSTKFLDPRDEVESQVVEIMQTLVNVHGHRTAGDFGEAHWVRLAELLGPKLTYFNGPINSTEESKDAQHDSED